MARLDIKLKNCFGISKLEKEFDFNEKRNTKIIYASNGVMKTSFAKTFQAISKSKDPKDELFPKRESEYSIKFNNTDISPKQILVVESYSNSYSSKEKMGTLLVDFELKKQYQQILEKIDNKKNDVFKSIKTVSGSSNAESEICSIFKGKNIFEILYSLSIKINQTEYKEIDFKYNDIINQKVSDFFKANYSLIEEYIKKIHRINRQFHFFQKRYIWNRQRNRCKQISVG